MSLKEMINSEVGRFLKLSRLRHCTSMDLAEKFIGYGLHEIEDGKKGIACCDIVRLSEFYQIPKSQVANWFFDFQMKIQKER